MTPTRLEYDTNRLGLPGGVIGHVEGGQAVIAVVMVDDDARQQGVGRRIVADFEAWATANGASAVVGNSRQEAVGFWRALGYDVGEVDHTEHAPIRKLLRPKFELRRQIDDLVYTFVMDTLLDGTPAYRRQDRDLWILRRQDRGWVVWDIESETCLGIPWGILPDQQGDHPPEGDWVSKKGPKSYVYTLTYLGA